jgi:hypothetical protein
MHAHRSSLIQHAPLDLAKAGRYFPPDEGKQTPPTHSTKQKRFRGRKSANHFHDSQRETLPAMIYILQKYFHWMQGGERALTFSRRVRREAISAIFLWVSGLTQLKK